ncbi:uncharacterized protein LOC128496435 [Spea bombifrons]|uniref:uncharacterized protein LOC128496435 n=1 Tax=Spea bombifrons TaxID=233779 RepID=UPI00234A5CA3|nr:uncharacterized protein LOC128496435 [Spea bombifrons]
MDPNLLRLPEVVLERLQVKMEEDEPENECRATAAKSELHSFPSDGYPDGDSDRSDINTLKEEPDCENPASAAEGEMAAYAEEGQEEQNTRVEHGAMADTLTSDQERIARGAEKNSKWRRASRTRCKGQGGLRHQFGHRDRYRWDCPGRGERSNMCMDEDRQRGPHFTPEEKKTLVDGVLRHYKELCAPSSASSLQKQCIWQEIVNEVNSKGSMFRTVEACKKRFADCRRVVKAKMASLEKKSMGEGDPDEEVRFNSWEDKLRQKILQLSTQGVDGAPDHGPGGTQRSAASETQSSAWPAIIDTTAPEFISVLDSEETPSPSDQQVLGEWSEDDGACLSPLIPPEELEAAPAAVSSPPPAPQHVKNSQKPPDGREEYKRLRQLSQARNMELHKLRENVFQGNALMAQQLHGLSREVRELNAHVRQMHINQTQFNLMFQNYLSDTKQFYRAVVQALHSLHRIPGVSPMASPACSSPASPRPATASPPPPSPPTTSSS